MRTLPGPMKYILPGFKKGLWGRSCIHIFHSQMFYSTDDGQIVLLHFDEMDQDTICVNSECVLMLTICSGTFTPLSSAFLKIKKIVSFKIAEDAYNKYKISCQNLGSLC